MREQQSTPQSNLCLTPTQWPALTRIRASAVVQQQLVRVPPLASYGQHIGVVHVHVHATASLSIVLALVPAPKQQSTLQRAHSNVVVDSVVEEHQLQYSTAQRTIVFQAIALLQRHGSAVQPVGSVWIGMIQTPCCVAFVAAATVSIARLNKARPFGEGEDNCKMFQFGCVATMTLMCKKMCNNDVDV